MISEFPPVSIYIVTCLGSEERCRVLKAVCENALALRYPEFEVVVSDNAGPFLAEEALKSIDDPRLKVFRNSENLGFNGNMNLCVDRCSYDIFKLQCDDDLLHPDCLTLTVPYADDRTFVVSDHEKYSIGADPAALNESYTDTPEVEIREPGYGPDFWEFPYIALPGCTLVTRNMFSELEGYDTQTLVSDWDFLIKARLKHRILHVKRTLCFLGIWDGSLTQQMLKTKPYFFPVSGLYTKFKILRSGALNATHQKSLQRMILKECFLDTLRLLKNFYRRKYWSGYCEYMGYMMQYLRKQEITTVIGAKERA